MLATAVISATVAIMWTSCGHLGLGGGAYAVSPDGRWLAEISDAHSKVHERSFGVIRLWDLAKYPSQRRGVSYYGNKAPTVRLEFPQVFRARDEKCKVNWATNSSEFFIEFESGVSSQGFRQARRFRYDLGADVFSLSTTLENR